MGVAGVAGQGVLGPESAQRKGIFCSGLMEFPEAKAGSDRLWGKKKDKRVCDICIIIMLLY